MSRFDLRRIADDIQAQYPDVAVYVDTVHHPPTVIEWRCKYGQIKVWQSGNTYPRLDVSNLMPRDYPLLRAVTERLEAAKQGEQS